MGSSGGSTNYKQPRIPAPPASKIAGYGETAALKPNWVNFLGDTNVPSTGLTPEMLAMIDSGAYAQPGGSDLTGGGGGSDSILAMIMARLDELDRRPGRGGAGGPFGGASPQRRMAEGGGGSNRGGYTSSSPSASARASNPGGLY